MKIKICGLRDAKNIQAISQLAPDYMGFIFYEKSPRNANTMLSSQTTAGIPKHIQKIGVFVNETASTVRKVAEHYGLDGIQLHGNESPAFCLYFKQLGYTVWKTFSVHEANDFMQTKAYALCCTTFLFDTATPAYGGSGQAFNWELLEHYTGTTPFWLSGGLGLDNIETALTIKHPALLGFDLNSKLEEYPGIKNKEITQQLLNTIRHEYI